MQESQPFYAEIIIIGAGLAGLMAADWLQENGSSPLLIEKEASIGGRMATWQTENGRADYGAQFFTVRNPIFQKYVDQWLAQDIVFTWSHGWSDGSLGTTQADGFPRYAARNGMSALAQHLAHNKSTHLNTQINTITQNNTQWHLRDQNGNLYTSDALILTPPVPHSLALLASGNISLSDRDQQALSRIQYAPSWTALFAVEGDTTLPPSGVLHRPEAIVSWIADNQQKGVSPHSQIITMHIHPQKSGLWFFAPPEEIAGIFRAEIRPFLTPNSTLQLLNLHLWPYALPTTLHPQACLIVQEMPSLIFAGDAFNGPRIEGAALSGLAAAQAIPTLNNL